MSWLQASKVAKRKDQEKADKAEKERARQEAQMVKAMKRARDTEAKTTSAKAGILGDAAANGQEPSPKRCELHAVLHYSTCLCVYVTHTLRTADVN